MRALVYGGLKSDVANAPSHDVDVVDLAGASTSRRALVPILAGTLKIVLRGVELATAAREAVFGGRKLDLVGMGSAELLPLVGRLSAAALELRGLPRGTAATRSLTRALHAAALAEEARGGGGDVDHAGLIIAIAFQCSQVQGLRGKGVDANAIAWARARVVVDGKIDRSVGPASIS